MPSPQNKSLVHVGYCPLVNGELPGSPRLRLLDFVSFQMNATKETAESKRVAKHRRTTGLAHTNKSVAGTLQDHLALAAHDALLAGSIGGTWVAGGTATGSFAVDGAANKLTRATGSWLAVAGMRPDVMVDVDGFDTPANGGRFRVLAVTATDLILDGDLVTEAEQAGVTVSVVGAILQDGTADPQFLFERYDPARAGFNSVRRYEKCYLGGFDMSMPQNDYVGVSYPVSGIDMLRSDTRLDNDPLPTLAGSLFTMRRSFIAWDGGEITDLTELSLKGESPLNGAYRLGEGKRRAMYRGTQKVTGNLKAVLEGDRLAQAFEDEETFRLWTMLEASNGEDFLAWCTPQTKLTSCEEDAIQGEGGELMTSADFQSFGDDSTPLVWFQRSNPIA